MKYFIPTYDQCREICDAQENFLFFEQKYVINGFNVSIFDYKLASPGVFTSPVPGKDYLAHELRGLTFIFNHDGTLFNHYLLLAKFFNINQCETTQYNILKNYEIECVHEKMDGSVVSFVKFPDGVVLGKSKASFISDMAVAATEIYNADSDLSAFVDDMLNQDIIPVFEYISPYNRVVIEYKTEELILLQLRDNKTGKYLSLDRAPKTIKRAEEYVKTLDEIISDCLVMENTEGNVIRFKNDLLAKQKTKWYYERHNLYTETLKRENEIIPLILNDTIDDVLANVNDVGKNVDVEIIHRKLNKYIMITERETNKLLENFTGDIKSFVETYRKYEYFHYAMHVINQKGDLIEFIKQCILKETYFLMKAKDFLSKIDLE